MLAEIFMARMEAAVRLQQETASLSSSPFIPFTPNNQFLFKDKTARPADRPGGRLEMGKSPKSDWPVLFSAFARRGPPDRIHTIIGEGAAAAFARRLSSRFQTRIRHRQTGIHLD